MAKLAAKLALANADPANWTWADYQRRHFEENPVWQQFADKWRNNEDLNREDPSDITLDNLALPASGDDSLMIRNCYVEAEKFVWKIALSSPRTGVIITGQPGIGKTLFIWYLLVKLLKFETSYPTSSNANNYHLPSPGAGSFIWLLFDLSPEETVPACVFHPQCFPVQGPSPNPSLYNWRKQRGPEYTVFPLWTLDELDRAARGSHEFKAFSTYLSNVIRRENWKDPEFLSTVTNPGLVEFLQKICQEERPPESFNEAFDILLNGLVSRFGVIPRQVFRAMFDSFNKVVEVHDSALTMSFEELQKAADGLARDDPFADVKGPSHRVISLDNIVSEMFSKRLWDESQVTARSMIKHFLDIPQTRGLADSIFKPFAHRCIANPGETGGTWALRPMSSSEDSNSFVLRDPESSETVPGFPRIKRELLSFQPKDLGHLYDNAYYTPTIINHLLFDSFIIGFSTPPEAQHLWLLQMTSTLHKGLQKGYLVAQDIIERIQQQRGPGQPSQEKKPDPKGKGQGRRATVS
ncbi:hypothetical protein F5887DRAFT_1281776 [Amanita rubescens]|nr:hypothetical protein F5887DRAFT_1281776 [Amanita rubescens]